LKEKKGGKNSLEIIFSLYLFSSLSLSSLALSLFAQTASRRGGSRAIVLEPSTAEGEHRRPTGERDPFTHHRRVDSVSIAAMTSGVGVSEASGVANQRLTAHALVSVAVAASGGALFGYDLGVTGGVSTSDPFLEEFFPAVLERKRAAAAAATAAAAAPSPYCTYDSHLLTLFTSSAFLAAALTTLFVAGATTRRAGRRFSLRLSGALFCLGIGLAAGAANLGMLIAGRLLIGVAIGFANQAVPLFLSEVAPTRLRGAVNVSRAGKFFPVGETTTRTAEKKGSTLRPPFFSFSFRKQIRSRSSSAPRAASC
jgi:hypothetical protein